MLKKSIYLVVNLTFIAFSQSFAQGRAPDRIFDFHSPLNIDLSLAGNFGELRPGHFHAGLDIRTQGRENLPIFSIDSGVVSRVAISLDGYGKVVYIDHPSGITSVYAHLNSFYPELQQIVEEWQYAHRQFELDLDLRDKNITVKRGQQVGLSGNTGGSAGPHLHFETRKTSSEKAINPFHFGFVVRDNIKPSIYGLMIYPLNDQSGVEGHTEKQYFKTRGNGEYYEPVVQSGQAIRVKGKIAFGLYTMDKNNSSSFNNGIYEIKLFKDEKLVYKHTLDSLNFDFTRSINVHLDYEQYVAKKRKVQRSYILPGNRLETYSSVTNKGEFFFLDDTLHEVKYVVSDFYGNQSELRFMVRGDQNMSLESTKISPGQQTLLFGQENRFESDSVRIFFPSSCLYEDTPLGIRSKPAVGRCKTPRYFINELTDPLNDYMELSIKLPESIRAEKAIIVSLDKKSQILAPEGGEVEDGWISVKTRSFGPYTVMEDVTAPTLSCINVSQSSKISPGTVIKFKVDDDIAGVQRYDALLDGEWIILEYQKNKGTFSTLPPEHLRTSGPHLLTVTVKDATENTRVYELRYSY
jgi:murein DD-endopeptidase MepM/ murein hydrolase activator NlpD